MAIEVKVPDIGDFKDVPVITVFVKPGDTVAKDDPLVELESDKATMEVPSPAAGKVAAVAIKEGDRVSEGTVILTLEGEAPVLRRRPRRRSRPRRRARRRRRRHPRRGRGARLGPGRLHRGVPRGRPRARRWC